MDRGRVVHREDTKGLQALGTLQRLDDDPGALIGGLIAVAAQARDMHQHIRHAIIRNDEAESLRYIEPLDHAGDLDDASSRIANQIAERFGFSETCRRPFGPNRIRRHEDARRRFVWRLLPGASRISSGEDNIARTFEKNKNFFQRRLWNSPVYIPA